MIVSFVYGITEIIDGIVRVLSLGLVSTRLPMWYLTRVEEKRYTKFIKDTTE